MKFEVPSPFIEVSFDETPHTPARTVVIDCVAYYNSGLEAEKKGGRQAGLLVVSDRLVEEFPEMEWTSGQLDGMYSFILAGYMLFQKKVADSHGFTSTIDATPVNFPTTLQSHSKQTSTGAETSKSSTPELSLDDLAQGA